MKPILDALHETFPDLATSEFRGQARLVAPPERLFAVLQTLKEKLAFDMLVDVTCVDYLDYPGDCPNFRGQCRAATARENGTVPLAAEGDRHIFRPQVQAGGESSGRKMSQSPAPRPKDRFGLVYLLANTGENQRVAVRCFVNDPDPVVPTAVPLWEGANWLEREVWDMFGIRFAGHPDPRRILLPEEFSAYPLRKDYPLQGRGERHNFPVISRAEG